MGTIANVTAALRWRISPQWLYDPPQLARFVVGRPPGLGQQCVVVGLGTAAENELRLIVRLVVHGTEPRHRDDDIAVLHNDSNVVRLPQGERPFCPQPDLFSLFSDE